MNGLRKLTTLIIVFAVLLVSRFAWSESSKIMLSSSPLMQPGINSVLESRDWLSGHYLNLGSVPKGDTRVERPVLQTKVDVGDKKLHQSFDLLKNSVAGREIAVYLDEHQIKISFGHPETPGAAAVFVPNFVGNGGRIIVSEQLRKEQPSVIAAILAHEGTHAKMDSITDYDSVAQEYKCYIVQARVWKETRTAMVVSAGQFAAEISEPNPENDYAVEILRMDKREAYKQIWRDYKQIGIELPRQ